MESREGMVSESPRVRIDNQLKLVQEDLDNVEKRLEIINKELLGPRVPSPDERMLKEEEIKAVEAGGWLNLVGSRLGNFRNQLRRIKALEKTLEKSTIFSPKNATKGQQPTEE